MGNMRLGTLCMLVISLVLMAGCGDDGDTIIIGSARLAGSFPGNDVADSNLADDGFAFSQNAENIVGGPRVYHSSRSNRAIILFVTADGALDSLWASYFNGSTVTPPVEIVAISSSGKQGDFNHRPSINKTVVMFYAPSGVAGNTASSRNGDAIILFDRRDTDDSGPNNEDDSNIRLFSAYFDVSRAGSASDAHGFGSHDSSGNWRPGMANIVDTDDGDNTTTNDTNNDWADDVRAFGVVSDGLHGQAEFRNGGNNFNATDFSDYFVAVWAQRDEVNLTATSDTTDTHMYWSRLDMTATPPSWSPAQRINTDVNSQENQGGSFVDNQTEVVSGTFWTYENSVFFYIEEFDTTSFVVDTVLQYSHYVGDFTSGQFLPNAAEVSPANDVTNFASSFFWEDPIIYGRDHNLSRTVAIFGHNIVNAGDSDDDLFITRFDPGATTAGSAFSAQDRSQIDLTGVSPTFQQDVLEVDTRISRDNDYILIAFLQEDSNFWNNLYVVRYVTDKIGGTPPPGSISNSLPTQPLEASEPSTDWGVTGFVFQDELGGPTLPPDETSATGVRRTGVQSDNDHMHLVYQEFEDGLASDDRDELFIVQFENQPAPATGMVRRDSLGDFQQGVFFSSNDINARTEVLDNGNGGAVVYYWRDQDWTPDPFDTTIPNLRLKGRNFDGLSVSGELDLNTLGLQIRGDLRALTLGREDPAGAVHLVFFLEDRRSVSAGQPASSIALRAIRFDKLDTTTPFTAMQFGQIHTVDTGQGVDASFNNITTSGGSSAGAAIYISQGGHLYYNEYTRSNDRWRDAADLIVDNDSGENSFFRQVRAFDSFAPPEGNFEGETARALIFWRRNDSDGDRRLFVRIHN
ncbi:MAG: hypothetical protein O7H41_15045 [Planctomycetota bacterium]|nr:hypothetical protein [Planctomycetota bacterium]